MKRIYFYIIFILTSIVIVRYSYLYVFKYQEYYVKYVNKTDNILYGLDAPRGRILDRNGKVLVDNKGIKTIVFRNINNYDLDDISKYLVSIIDNKDIASDIELKRYYMNHNNVDYLLNENELKDLEYRKISLEDKEDIILSRIDKEILEYSDDDKYRIKFYYMLNKGGKYDNKVILDNASDKECASINKLNIEGLSCEYRSERVYLYDTLNTLYGSVGNIVKENKDYYLSKGKMLNDLVGISYLEKEYDDYLSGERSEYIIDDGKLVKIKDERSGNDLVLSIDIDLQLAINDVIKKNIDNASNYLNTEYYKGSYVLVSDPNTGEIIASTGINKINDTYYDVTSNILTDSFTVGSVIKGASHTVGYLNNVIEKDKKINDACVKLYQVPEKCSFKRLGYIDDISALKTSSNYYQFMTAIKLTGNTYKNNMKLNVTEDNFNMYRDIFKKYGLGSSTGIDLENESLGIEGKVIADDLYLNLSIGQYDTYTPLQLLNYINTLAMNGSRYSLHYLKEVRDDNNVIYSYDKKLLSKIDDNDFYYRIKQGFKDVLFLGTGRGYTDIKYNPAGKTGTSEVVIAPNVTAINQTYAMFAPYDNPKYSIVVISPNVSYNNDKNNYIAPINRLISKEVSKLVFEK